MNNGDRNRAIILLSGGLDSLAALGLSEGVELALTFDYGQKAAAREIEAASKIAKYYGITHKIIKLDWLAEITDTARTWVPNRNGLFLNIAASFADAAPAPLAKGGGTALAVGGFTQIIIGANAEEAETFPDNTAEFITRTNAVFEFSTMQKPQVIAPLINYHKSDIVNLAREKGMPLELAWSCYEGGKRPCDVCESCKRFNDAI